MNELGTERGATMPIKEMYMQDYADRNEKYSLLQQRVRRRVVRSERVTWWRRAVVGAAVLGVSVGLWYGIILTGLWVWRITR